MSTEYGQVESDRIDRLPWYQDKALHDLVLSLLQCGRPQDTLVDLCSGTSTYLKSFLGSFRAYVAVEKSPFMIDAAKKSATSMRANNNKRTSFIRACALEYAANNLAEHNPSHVLIKNALQFFDADVLLSTLRSNLRRGACVVAIQTIRDGGVSDDLFPLLPEMRFKVRVKRCYSEPDLIKAFADNHFLIHRTEKLVQEIDLDAWLDYHGAGRDEIVTSRQALLSLSLEEKESQGVVVRGQEIGLRRVLFAIQAVNI